MHIPQFDRFLDILIHASAKKSDLAPVFHGDVDSQLYPEILLRLGGKDEFPLQWAIPFRSIARPLVPMP